MKRLLQIEDGIISGYNMWAILEVFSQIKNSFTQRKEFDEYYFDAVEVEFTTEDIQKLNDDYFNVEISGYEITDKDTIDVMFADGKRTTTACISLARLKELIIDEAYEIITQPECSSSSCSVNGFYECDPINEDMEYAGIYLCVGK